VYLRVKDLRRGPLNYLKDNFEKKREYYYPCGKRNYTNSEVKPQNPKVRSAERTFDENLSSEIFYAPQRLGKTFAKELERAAKKKIENDLENGNLKKLKYKAIHPTIHGRQGTPPIILLKILDSEKLYQRNLLLPRKKWKIPFSGYWAIPFNLKLQEKKTNLWETKKSLPFNLKV